MSGVSREKSAATTGIDFHSTAKAHVDQRCLDAEFVVRGSAGSSARDGCGDSGAAGLRGFLVFPDLEGLALFPEPEELVLGILPELRLPCLVHLTTLECVYTRKGTLPQLWT